MHDDKILVFLSRPNPFLDSHQYFILKLQEHFEKYNIQEVLINTHYLPNPVREFINKHNNSKSKVKIKEF